MRTLILLVTFIPGVMSCRGVSDRPQESALSTTRTAGEVPLDRWIGVYSSTKEVGGFSGTVLALEKGVRGEVSYRKRFYSDVQIGNEIGDKEKTGSCLVDGRHIYVPDAFGYSSDGKVRLMASVERYTLLTINGQTVLLRDDALAAFEKENKLYDYGILMKVSDDQGLIDLESVEHRSIKVLYQTSTKPWRDPFVHGPNER
jgi:hypothetical protein